MPDQHGVTLPAGDGRVLKNWLLEHGDDAANRGAMKACHFEPPGKATAARPVRRQGARGQAGGRPRQARDHRLTPRARARRAARPPGPVVSVGASRARTSRKSWSVCPAGSTFALGERSVRLP